MSSAGIVQPVGDLADMEDVTFYEGFSAQVTGGFYVCPAPA